MDLKKKVRAELRDLLAQKKIEQEAQANLIIEVSSLREEKENLQTTIESEKAKYQISADLLKQETSFLKQEKERLEVENSELLKLNSDIEVRISENTNTVLKLEQRIQDLTISESAARAETQEYVNKLTLAKRECGKQETIVYDKNLEIDSLNSKKLALKANISNLENKIQEENNKLQNIIKEQARHSQWDEYLQDKENFVSEQFKLLGVKYIVYNSK